MFPRPFTTPTIKQFCIALAAIVSAITVVAYAATPREEAIAERLEPVGTVCMAGEECSAGAAAAASAGPRAPEEVYDASCKLCHATGVTESPILGDVEAWAPRIAKGTDILYENALVGFNAMPMKGACMTCSDEEITTTVDWMLEQSQ